MFKPHFEAKKVYEVVGKHTKLRMYATSVDEVREEMSFKYPLFKVVEVQRVQE